VARRLLSRVASSKLPLPLPLLLLLLLLSLPMPMPVSEMDKLQPP
jgi:hypothetical protein